MPEQEFGIRTVFSVYRENGIMNSDDSDECAVQFCPQCGWWYLYTHSREYPAEFVENIYSERYYGVPIVFDNEENEIVAEVSDLIDREHKDFSSVSPVQLERSLAVIFKSYYRASEVVHVGGPNDDGIDIYCVIEEHAHLIQVKRRTNGNAEGVSTVRDLIGAYALHHKDLTTSGHSAHIITSAKKFSPNSKSTTSRINMSKFDFNISLHSYDALQEMFDLATNRVEKPWLKIAPEPKFDPET